MESEIKQLTPEEYPELLKEINDPPKKLYIKGELPPQEMKYLCVVGSRKYSSYGKDVCKTLIEGLRGYPIVIVSGLAIGMDSIAHESALENGLTTIAVPGSGLSESVLHPKTNKELARKIVSSGGTMLSEFEKDFKATHYSFPQRNRVMAGMSHATLIIEAEEKSGTLITSKFATEYNRDVLTVPASIFSSNSFGPHMLLRLGATPIRNSHDILEALGFKPEEKQQSLNLEDLSDKEKKVIEVLSTPMERDELIEKLDLPIQEINVTLSAMEIKGIIKESMGEMRIAG
ncbi:MAG: DNA-protecting protein DprA [Parcubacteria group bacterium]|nr:DNA-protecting protein DprA [Parcubacteria group bacterium]